MIHWVMNDWKIDIQLVIINPMIWIFFFLNDLDVEIITLMIIHPLSAGDFSWYIRYGWWPRKWGREREKHVMIFSEWSSILFPCCYYFVPCPFSSHRQEKRREEKRVGWWEMEKKLLLINYQLHNFTWPQFEFFTFFLIKELKERWRSCERLVIIIMASENEMDEISE